MNRKLLILLFLSVVAVGVPAQSIDFLRNSEVVLGGGAMNYIGDLNNQTVFSPEIVLEAKSAFPKNRSGIELGPDLVEKICLIQAAEKCRV